MGIRVKLSNLSVCLSLSKNAFLCASRSPRFPTPQRGGVAEGQGGVKGKVSVSTRCCPCR